MKLELNITVSLRCVLCVCNTGKKSGREGGSSASPVERARTEAGGNQRPVTNITRRTHVVIGAYQAVTCISCAGLTICQCWE